MSGCQKQLLGPEPHRLPCRSHTPALASFLTSSCLTCAGCLSGPHPNLFPLISSPRITRSHHKYSLSFVITKSFLLFPLEIIQRCLITRETHLGCAFVFLCLIQYLCFIFLCSVHYLISSSGRKYSHLAGEKIEVKTS